MSLCLQYPFLIIEIFVRVFFTAADNFRPRNAMATRSRRRLRTYHPPYLESLGVLLAELGHKSLGGQPRKKSQKVDIFCLKPKVPVFKTNTPIVVYWCSSVNTSGCGLISSKITLLIEPVHWPLGQVFILKSKIICMVTRLIEMTVNLSFNLRSLKKDCIVWTDHNCLKRGRNDGILNRAKQKAPFTEKHLIYIYPS